MTQKALIQRTLFDNPIVAPEPPHNATDTSKAAADGIVPHACRQRETILQYLLAQDSNGATDDEIQVALELSGDTVRPRRGELVAAGCVVGSGRRRPTRKGRDAIVWVATGRPFPGK